MTKEFHLNEKAKKHSDIVEKIVSYLTNIKKNEQHTPLKNNGLKLIYHNNQ